MSGIRTRNIGGLAFSLPVGAKVVATRTVYDKHDMPECVVLIFRKGDQHPLLTRGPMDRNEAVSLVRKFNAFVELNGTVW